MCFINHTLEVIRCSISAASSIQIGCLEKSIKYNAPHEMQMTNFNEDKGERDIRNDLTC